MTVADNVRKLATAAMPTIEASLDTAEEMAAFAAAGREQGINWTALKAVLVARAKDNRDGGERLKKITEKADVALTYADMMACPNVAKQEKTSPQSKPSPRVAEKPPSPSPSGDAEAAPTSVSVAASPIPDEPAGTHPPADLLDGEVIAGDTALPAGSPSDDLDIPGFLRRPFAEART